MSEIEDNEIIEVAIDDVKLDPDNPNKMTQREEDGLEASMKGKSGYANLIAVDANMIIVNGEHRYNKLKASGRTKIKVIKLNKIKTATERKFERQIQNKLHGRFDKKMELEEYKEFLEKKLLPDLAHKLGSNEDEFIA